MITGVKGSIRWHHYTAAAIEGYAIAPRNKAGTAWDLAATVVLSDTFKMKQTPLTFRAVRAKYGVDGHTVVTGAWVWPIVSHQLVDHQLTARLGPPEEET